MSGLSRTLSKSIRMLRLGVFRTRHLSFQQRQARQTWRKTTHRLIYHRCVRRRVVPGALVYRCTRSRETVNVLFVVLFPAMNFPCTRSRMKYAWRKQDMNDFAFVARLGVSVVYTTRCL